MSKKKEKLLQKYIEKKKKQLKRDELMAQIAQIDKENMKRVKKENFNEKRVKKIEVYEKSLDDLIYLESTKNESCSSYKSEDRNEIGNNREFNDYNSEECKDHNSEDKSSHEECEDYKVEEYDNHNSEEDDDKSCNEDTDVNDTLILSNNEIILEDAEHSNTKDYLIVIKNQSSIYDRITVDRPFSIQNQRQQLPIFFEQEEITSLIRNNPIVLIKGPTGCGKTTQIPQFIYESNLNQGGLIAITQPRRISTISVCSRINEELNQDLCGYQIRYDNNFKKYHKMVAMTDGILIKEIQEDFLLSKYSVIILDEVHERSCNLDILISLLSKIVKIRNGFKNKEGNGLQNKESNIDDNDNPNFIYKHFLSPLKVILMTASDISFDLFKLFKSLKSFEVPSAPHKLSIFYEEKTPSDYVLCALNTIKRIIKKEGKLSKAILVFLPSKSDIYKLKIHLEEDRLTSSLVILPLHSSLSKQEQSLVFKDYDKIKIILSTNIAETSITIPDIKYVIDTGLVKNKYVSPQGIVKYSIEYISKSSALQRAGRAGRTTKGTCYRLYSGETYNSFLDQDIPRIQYEPLDSLVLDLIALGIPDVHKFPFITKPPNLNIEIALSSLRRLGIIKNNNSSNYILTEAGKVISKLPIHPKHSHLLCIPNTTHLLPRLILVVSCLSVNFELKKSKDREKYFKSEKSDLIVMIKMFIDNVDFNSEALKMNNYLLKKFFKGDKLKEAHKSQISNLENEEKIELRRLFYKVYSNNLAIPNTDCYFYQNMNVYPSNSSIDPQDEFVVFEYLSQGNKKVFMKNVTIIEKEWVV